MKELQPINQNVIIDLSLSDEEQRTPGGIIIPDTAREKPQMGKVVGMSNIENPEVSVGDTVIFKKYSGTEIEFEGKKLLVIQYGDLLAKVVDVEKI